SAPSSPCSSRRHCREGSRSRAIRAPAPDSWGLQALRAPRGPSPAQARIPRMSIESVAATPARRRYRPTPTIAASIGLHAAAAAAAVARPELWPWTLGAVAANHAFLGAVGLWPRSTLLGPNITRLPARSRERGEIAITFDDGP